MTHLTVNKHNTILFSDNSVFTDNTSKLKKWGVDTMGVSMVAAEDKIYIGCNHSFAARFFKISTANSSSAVLTIKYYAGSTLGWLAVKNLADETSYGGVPFAIDGFISWDLPGDWVKNQVNSLPELAEDSSTGDGYGKYWIEITSSQDLFDGLIDWIGTIWTNEDYLKIRWPEVCHENYLPTGKTNWYELIEMSTKDVADDLNIKNIIDYELQAKDIDELANMTALKTLINILLPFRSSESMREMREQFIELYNRAKTVRLKGIDTNKDEKLDIEEKKVMGNVRIIRS